MNKPRCFESSSSGAGAVLSTCLRRFSLNEHPGRQLARAWYQAGERATGSGHARQQIQQGVDSITKLRTRVAAQWRRKSGHFPNRRFRLTAYRPLAGGTQDADRCICISQDFKDRRALLRGSQRIMR